MAYQVRPVVAQAMGVAAYTSCIKDDWLSNASADLMIRVYNSRRWASNHHGRVLYQVNWWLEWLQELQFTQD